MIFLQVFIAIYSLHLLRFNHNDLHVGNIRISQCERKLIKYKIEDHIYEYDNFGIGIKIYDFDFGYCDIVGENYFLANDSWESTGS